MAGIRTVIWGAWRRFFDWAISPLPDWLAERLRFWESGFGLILGLAVLSLFVVNRLPQWWDVPSLPSWEWGVLIILAILLFAEGNYRTYAPFKRKAKAKYEGLLPYQYHAEIIIAYCNGVQAFQGTDQQLRSDGLAWIVDTKNYLTQNFGQTRANLWDSQVENKRILRINPAPSVINVNRQVTLDLLWSRLHQLHDIMKEVDQ